MTDDELQRALDEGSDDVTAIFMEENAILRLVRAARGSKSRTGHALYLFFRAPSHLAAAADEQVGRWLRTRNAELVARCIHNARKAGDVSVERYLDILVDHLRAHVPSNKRDNSRYWSVMALAHFHDDEALSAVLDYAQENPDDRGSVVFALAFGGKLRSELARIERLVDAVQYHRHDPKGTWGDWVLAKIGDAGAHDRLIWRLRHDDEDLRAAQALCNIHGWPFSWEARGLIGDVRARASSFPEQRPTR